MGKTPTAKLPLCHQEKARYQAYTRDLNGDGHEDAVKIDTLTRRITVQFGKKDGYYPATSKITQKSLKQFRGLTFHGAPLQKLFAGEVKLRLPMALVSGSVERDTQTIEIGGLTALSFRLSTQPSATKQCRLKGLTLRGFVSPENKNVNLILPLEKTEDIEELPENPYPAQLAQLDESDIPNPYRTQKPRSYKAPPVDNQPTPPELKIDNPYGVSLLVPPFSTIKEAPPGPVDVDLTNPYR